MNKIISYILILAILVFIPFALGYQYASNKCDAKILKIEKAAIEAGKATQEQVNNISNEYQKKLNDANNKPPITVERRVFVKAKEDKCPVPKETTAGMDKEKSAKRIELAEQSIRSLERITAQLDKDYREVAMALKACIASF